MADICPNCNSNDVQHALDSAYCLNCGVKLNYVDGGLEPEVDVTVAATYAPADTSLATPTATPVYAEQESDRQPAVDTNQEPVPTDAPPGVTEKPAPDVEAENVAGELSDETPEEKTSGGPKDQPRTADLTDSGEPTPDTMVDHTAEEPVNAPDPTPEQVQAENEQLAAQTQAEQAQAVPPTEPRPGDPQTDQTPVAPEAPASDLADASAPVAQEGEV